MPKKLVQKYKIFLQKFIFIKWYYNIFRVAISIDMRIVEISKNGVKYIWKFFATKYEKKFRHFESGKLSARTLLYGNIEPGTFLTGHFNVDISSGTFG